MIDDEQKLRDMKPQIIEALQRRWEQITHSERAMIKHILILDTPDDE